MIKLKLQKIKKGFEKADLKDKDLSLCFSMRAKGTEPVKLFHDKFLQGT